MQRILIVDDEPDMRLAIKNVLRLRGYEILEAPDGPSALNMLSKSDVDLVLLDIRLPGMDGVEVLEKVRKKNRNLPVVMITGYGHVRSAVDVMKLGANEYLQKPFENVKLIETIRRFLEVKDTDKTAETEEVPIGKRKSRKRGKYIYTGFALVLLAFIFFVAKKAYLYKKSYTVENSNTSSITWVGNNLLLSDWLKETIYSYKISGGRLMLVRKYFLKGIHISSIGTENGFLYVADSWAKTLQKRRLDDTLSLIKEYKLDGGIISVFCEDGRLWTLDNDGVLKVKNLDEKFSVISSVKLKNHPDQIFRNGKTLWSASSGKKRIYKHRLDKDMKIIKTYFLKGFENDLPFSAFAWRKGRLWFSRDGENKIHEIGKGYLVSER